MIVAIIFTKHHFCKRSGFFRYNGESCCDFFGEGEERVADILSIDPVWLTLLLMLVTFGYGRQYVRTYMQENHEICIYIIIFCSILDSIWTNLGMQ